MMRQDGADDPRIVVANVVQHVQRLLNSRQGQSRSAPHYGMAMSIDLLRDMMMLLPETLHTIEQAILSTLIDHEPRLTQWRLREPTRVGAQDLTVYVAARLRHLPGQHTALVNIDVMPSGRIGVREAS